MPSEDIRRILEAAVRAPSGDNIQPWRFAVSPNACSVFATFIDRTLYTDRVATLISCGALIENIVLLAKERGYRAEVSYSPSISTSDHIADITFAASGEKIGDPLATAISERVTNRNNFSKTRLTAEEVKTLMNALLPLGPDISGRVIDNRQIMRTIAHGLAINVRLFLENPIFHSYFFKNLRWTRRDVEMSRDGIPVRTLRLSLLEHIELTWMRRWPVARFFSALGAARLAGSAYAGKYLAAGAFIAILSQEGKAEGLVAGGRALQRLWLEATRLHLGVQPIAGFMLGQNRSGLSGFEMLSTNLRRDAQKAAKDIIEALGIEQETIVMILRIGKAKPIANHTLRKEPICVTMKTT